MRYLLFIPFLLIACTGNVTSGPNYALQVSNSSIDPVLENIEKNIFDSFAQSLMQKQEKPLLSIEEKLEKLYQDKQQNLIQYWRGYAHYYLSVYHVQQEDKKQAEKVIDQGIELVESIKEKNAEDYALLALLQNFSIQFKGMKAMFISRTIRKNIDAAIRIDAENLRAYYVAGSNDYYTPEKYGGGKKAEEYLKKAIALPAQKIPNPYLPSWGKEEAYQMLIQMYIKKENYEAAKTHFQEATQLFPDSYMLNQLASKLVGK